MQGWLMTTMQVMSGQMAAIRQVILGASWIRLVEGVVRNAADETAGVKWDETGWAWIGFDENGMTTVDHFVEHAAHAVHAVHVVIVIAIVRSYSSPCFCFAHYGGVGAMARAPMNPLCRRKRADSGARHGRNDSLGFLG